MGFETAELNGWSATQNVGCNLQPLTPQQIAALNFNGAVTHVCGNGVISGRMSNNSSCTRPSNATTFFQHNLNIPEGNPCFFGKYNATADNFFRVYVNGVLAAGNAVGNTNCSNLANWNGNNWQLGFLGDFSNLLQIGNNEIVVELQNGVDNPPNAPHPMYFDGKFSFGYTPNTTSTFNHSLTGGQVPGFQTLTVLNTGIGLTQTWLLETSNNSNGPWNFFTSSTNQRLGASQNFEVPACTWIRVTHTVTLGNCSSVTVLVFRQCPESGTNGETKEEFFVQTNAYSANLVSEESQTYKLLNEVEIYDSTEKIITDRDHNLNIEKGTGLSIFPNPSNGEATFQFNGVIGETYKMTVVNSIGKEITNLLEWQGNFAFTLSNLPSGILFAKIINSKGELITTKKVLIRS